MFNWFSDMIGNVLIKKYLGTVLKKLITVVATILALKGIATAEQADSLAQLLIELIPGIIAFILSFWTSMVSRKAALLASHQQAAKLLQ